MTLFWHQGWAETSIRDLEEAVGVKAPSIYRRFGNKAGVERAVLERYLERVVERRIQLYLPPDGDPIDNLRAFVESSVEPDPMTGAVSGCLLTMAADRGSDDPGVASTVARGLALIETAIGRELARAAASNALPSTAVDAAKHQVLASFLGLMVLSRSGESPALLQRRARSVTASLGG